MTKNLPVKCKDVVCYVFTNLYILARKSNFIKITDNFLF